MKKSKVIFLALLACAFGASARTVTSDEATQAARGWVRRGKTLGVKFPSQVAQTAVSHSTTNGVKFYTVKMEKGGTVFTSGDTEFEPVIGFTPATNDFSKIDENSPLWALLNHDISQKKPQSAKPQLAFSTAAATVLQKPKTATELKWESLIEAGAALPPGPIPRLTTSAAAITEEEDIDDLRVPALVKSQWSQSTARGLACYNYYTPPGPDGSTGNAVCGCVATAMSQIMRYFQYPTEPINTVKHTCSYNGNPIDLTTQGGVYDWANMPLVPATEFSLTEEQRQAIGKLTSDAGISVWMSYSKDGSGAYTPEGGTMMREVFGYKNAVSYVNSDWYFYPQLIEDGGTVRAETLQRTMFVNFDAGKPVLVSIPGHAVLADGYGYVDEIDYVHFNMGWAGQNDWWYNIPDLTEAGFDAVNIITYNLFTNAASTCAIMSGRIVDDDGIAIADADVTISDVVTGNVVMETKTNERGIWSAVLEAGTYDVLAKSGKLMAELDDVVLKTPASSSTHWVNCNIELVSPSSPAKLGNSWGNDMVLAEPTVRIVVDAATTNLYTSLDKALRAATNGNEAVEILLPTILKKPVTLEADCTIVATNEKAAESAITCRNGAKITIADGATVTMTNVVFDVAGRAKTVTVSDGGVLKIGGVCGLKAVETYDKDGLVVVSELTEALYVDCANASRKGDTFALGYATATNCANLLLHYSNSRLGGKAEREGGDIVFQWAQGVPVPRSEAICQFNGENYRSLADVFEDFKQNTNSEIVVFSDTTFTNCVQLITNLIIRGEGDVRPVLTAAGTSGFRILDGGSLTISNLVFSGYVDEDSSDYYGFIGIDGGDLTLDDGAMLEGMTGNVCGGSGIVDIDLGTMIMRNGSAVVDCSAGGGGGVGMGGAICVWGGGGVLDLQGGMISNCFASSVGGGVYVYDYNGESGTVKVSGDLAVRDNRSDRLPKDDICLNTTQVLPNFRLAGALTGTNVVGVWISTPLQDEDEADINAEGKPFATNAVGTVLSTTAFFNDTDDTLEAAVGDNGMLVWKKKDMNGTCPEDEASAHIYYPDGGEAHYPDLATAFKHMTNGTVATVKMYKDGQTGELFDADVALPSGCQVVLMSRDADAYEFLRDGDVGLTVAAGASLTLTNVLFKHVDDNSATKPYFAVVGGSLSLSADSYVAAGTGTTYRAANGITVSEGGVFTILPGAKVCDCYSSWNLDKFTPDTATQYYAVGGGVLIDDGSTANLRGGEITSCHAPCGGGLYACNGSHVFVSGDFKIVGNEWIPRAGGVGGASNLLVTDLSELYLDDVLTGDVHVANSVRWRGDTNIVAMVTASWQWGVTALTNSASHFISDETGDFGVVVTNVAETLVVWSRAVRDGVFKSQDTVRNDKTFYVVAEVGAYTPLSMDPLPELAPNAKTADAVRSALTISDLADKSVEEAINGSEDPVNAYEAFRAWAMGVDGGADAVVESDKAGVSYDFGTMALLANDPTVEIVEIANGANGLTVSVVVKDGGDPVAVASEKVAEMFEATSDVGDWTKEIELTVSDLTNTTSDEVQFKIVPVGNPSATFIRLKY